MTSTASAFPTSPAHPSSAAQPYGPAGDAPALLLDGIAKTYRSKAGAVDALRGVTYHFARGSFTAVMGPSGSGKSTLLQCAAGLDRPTNGTVVLNGIPLHGLGEVALTKLRREQMGFVFQAYNLLPSLTVYDNVALPLRLMGRRPGRGEVEAVLTQVGLDGKAKRRPAELSGGQQQRVAIARALVTRPAVLFADEPTGALDSGTSRQVLGLLREATVRSGQTTVMVTHDPVAAAYAERVLFLSDGLVAGSLDRGTPQQIAAAMSELER
ncbi:putative ABC transport system ATP-binding protein [Kribbella amoyensis]|uniref:Putative ABC transport system ATP-binding protein n=1 Tax=Kribbella amoyensis TaxID=996641 RepID=A0A561BZ05_9ACTN|nr:ABC transporter ATP-binding protein [Kribbella amoyensis]TWD84114.1 putative ABC transport system ATP-binding protein [Kribbella amoyensis]